MRVLFGAALVAGAVVITTAISHGHSALLHAYPGAAHAEWSVDKRHSTVGFSVRHFFTPVKGRFSSYEAEMKFNPQDPSESSVKVAIDASSVDTNHENRDADLRSDSFLDVAAFPSIVFESTSVRDMGGGQYMVIGMLTIRDVTREVEMPGTVLGIQDIPADMQEMFGSQVASFEASLTIDRRDFGVGSGRWAETAIVGAEVEILITVEAHHAAH